MKKYLILILFIFTVYRPGVTAENILIPYSADGKWGFCDHNLNIIVKPRYDLCGEMIENLAFVKENGKYGYINEKGMEIIPAIYSSAGNFSQGSAIVSKDGKYGVINKNGGFYIPLTDYTINRIAGNAAIISKDYLYGLMGEGGKILLPAEYPKLDVMNDVLLVAARYSDPKSFITGKNTLVDYTGKPAGEKNYDIIYPLDSGYAKVSDSKKWGYINPSGKEVAPPVYEDIRNIKPDGTACFLKNGKWGIIDGSGNAIVQPVYESMGGGNGYYDEAFQYNLKYFTVRSGGKWGIVSLKGEVIVKPEYTMFGFGKNGYIPAYKTLGVKNNLPVTGYTVLDSEGNELFAPKTEYHSTGEVSEGMVAVSPGNVFNNKWGYINLKGELVIKLNFDGAGAFNNGYAVVKNNGLYGLINTRGIVVEDFRYQQLYASGNYPGLYIGEISGRKLYFKPEGNHYWKQ